MDKFKIIKIFFHIYLENWIHFHLYSIRNPSLIEIYLQLINKKTDISINFVYKSKKTNYLF